MRNVPSAPRCLVACSGSPLVARRAWTPSSWSRGALRTPSKRTIHWPTRARLSWPCQIIDVTVGSASKLSRTDLPTGVAVGGGEGIDDGRQRPVFQELQLGTALEAGGSCRRASAAAS